MSIVSLVIGVVFLAAGLYQFVEPTLGGLRVVGLLNKELEAPPGPTERAFALFVGVALVGFGLVFLWLGQY